MNNNLLQPNEIDNMPVVNGNASTGVSNEILKHNSCAHKNRKNIDSRPVVGGRRRRYECLDCKERFSTMEILIDNVKRGHKNKMINQLQKQLGLSIDQINAVNELIRVFSI